MLRLSAGVLLAALAGAGCGGSSPGKASSPRVPARHLSTRLSASARPCQPLTFLCQAHRREHRGRAPLWCPFAGPVSSTRFDTRLLLGLGVAAAERDAQHHGCTSRIVELNGRGLAITSDLRSNRVDLAVTHGVVTGVDVG
jgi:hypothetical protein